MEQEPRQGFPGESYADVSDFKMINDIYGYAFGDFALQRVADWVKEDIPEDSACGSLGAIPSACAFRRTRSIRNGRKRNWRVPVDDGTTRHYSENSYRCLPDYRP